MGRYDFTRDLAAAFNGPDSVSVECDGECTGGFLNDEDLVEEDETGQKVYPAGTVCFIQNGSLSTLTEHGRLNIDGVEHRVDKALKQDGVFQRLIVVKVPE